MNDRELLELAARAAGVAHENVLRNGGVFVHGGREWNPLVDDGDALRLAVKLGMCLDLRHGQSWAAFNDNPDSALSEYMGAAEHHNADPCAATRRAIVRAAAALEGNSNGGA